MVSWTWLVIVGGIFFLHLHANRTRARRSRNRQGLGHRATGRPDATFRPAEMPASADRLLDEQKAPSSTYEGRVCFFDSIEHRDMFEANHHKPVALDPLRSPSVERYGRRAPR
jgi:hypothetical protein